MESTFLRVKGIIKKGDKYLLLKRWVDDRIPEPFVWEFVDTEVNHGEAPDEAVLRAIHELLSIDGKIEKIEYTWSSVLGDTHCVGIAYICSISGDDESHIVLAEDYGEYEWVRRDQFEQYIENQFVLQDLKGKTL
ncbi:MAG: NUDIX domain-containing protein [Roseburia sp.]|nr:NUDIX domain-containing protein [Ruminococcus sp.]MCM1154090.1 NUDIX domain-containing protein [Roseburia sp.]MCM1241988.1 NUDIX domain-containing protein [Roseburia sp.]